MNKTQMKEELISRYKYIFENAMYILAPYMYEETHDELAEKNKKYKKEGYDILISETPLIYLKELQSSLMLDLEAFLLSDVPLEESKLYADLETRDVYELTNENEMSAELQNKMKRGRSIVERLIQPKFSPKNENDIIHSFADLFKE